MSFTVTNVKSCCAWPAKPDILTIKIKYSLKESSGKVYAVTRQWATIKHSKKIAYKYWHNMKRPIVSKVTQAIVNMERLDHRQITKMPPGPFNRYHRVISKTLITAPKPLKPPQVAKPEPHVTASQLEVSTQRLNLEIQALKAEVTNITQRLQVATAEKEALQAKLDKVQEKLDLLLSILMD